MGRRPVVGTAPVVGNVLGEDMVLEDMVPVEGIVLENIALVVDIALDYPDNTRVVQGTDPAVVGIDPFVVGMGNLPDLRGKDCAHQAEGKGNRPGSAVPWLTQDDSCFLR